MTVYFSVTKVYRKSLCLPLTGSEVMNRQREIKITMSPPFVVSATDEAEIVDLNETKNRYNGFEPRSRGRQKPLTVSSQMESTVTSRTGSKRGQ